MSIKKRLFVVMMWCCALLLFCGAAVWLCGCGNQFTAMRKAVVVAVKARNSLDKGISHAFQAKWDSCKAEYQKHGDAVKYKSCVMDSKEGKLMYAWAKSVDGKRPLGAHMLVTLTLETLWDTIDYAERVRADTAAKKRALKYLKEAVCILSDLALRLDALYPDKAKPVLDLLALIKLVVCK